MDVLTIDTNGDGWIDEAYWDANYNGVFGDYGDYGAIDVNYDGYFDVEGWIY